MIKQELMDKINSMEASEEMKQELLGRVSLYPENLEQVHLSDFDAYLSETIVQKSQGAHALQGAANQIDAALQKDQVEYNSKLKQIELDTEEVMAEMDAFEAAPTATV